MAGRYDERFDKLTGLVKKVGGRVDEIQLEMRDMRKETSELRNEVESNAVLNSSRFDKLDAALQVVSARHDEVIPKVIAIQKDVNRISETQAEQTFKMIELMNRLSAVDRRLKKLDDRTAEVDSEVKEIRKTMVSLIDPILDGKTIWANIRYLEERIARLEEKVS